MSTVAAVFYLLRCELDTVELRLGFFASRFNDLSSA